MTTIKSKRASQIPLVILAAGQASRMGTPKGLLAFDKKPWLLQQLKTFKDTGGTQAVVVLGSGADDYFSKIPSLKNALNEWRDPGAINGIDLSGLKWSVRVNENPARGQFSSIQTALQFLAKEKNSGVFILPVDVPCPNPETWHVLVDSLDGRGVVKACLPVFQEKGGHPALLSKTFTHTLLTLAPEDSDSRLDVQLHLLPKDQLKRVAVDDDRVIRNLNSPEEWGRFQGG